MMHAFFALGQGPGNRDFDTPCNHICVPPIPVPGEGRRRDKPFGQLSRAAAHPREIERAIMFGTGGGFAPSAAVGQSETVVPQFGGPSGQAPTRPFGGQQPAPTKPAPAHAGKGGVAVSAGDCYYFLQGTCTKVCFPQYLELRFLLPTRAYPVRTAVKGR